jgi:hypothetical protein
MEHVGGWVKSREKAFFGSKTISAAAMVNHS